MVKAFRILAALALLTAGPTFAASFEQGTHYTVISDEATAEPEVLEFFSYGCGGCYMFDPWFKRAKDVLGEQAKFQYVPVDFGGGFWTPSQNLFLVLEALGRREELHDLAFQYIHGERNGITESKAKAFLAQHGVSEEAYEKTLKSFAVHVREQRYDQLTKRYRISSTPTVIVNGKYRVEHTKLTGGPDQFVELLRYLLQNP